MRLTNIYVMLYAGGYIGATLKDWRKIDENFVAN